MNIETLLTYNNPSPVTILNNNPQLLKKSSLWTDYPEPEYSIICPIQAKLGLMKALLRQIFTRMFMIHSKPLFPNARAYLIKYRFLKVYKIERKYFVYVNNDTIYIKYFFVNNNWPQTDCLIKFLSNGFKKLTSLYFFGLNMDFI